MRPFFLCIILLAASITAIQPPGGESIPEAGTSTGPGTIPEAGPSNLEAGSDPEAGQSLIRYGKRPTQVIGNKIRLEDAWWTEQGNVRPANEGEEIRGISTYTSIEAGALLFHLN